MNEVTAIEREEQRVSRSGIQIRKAQRRKAKLRLALMGPTGSGKTMSALRLAFGIGGKVGVIDTENGSADLYADAGDYDVITLTKPYDPAKYKEAIAAFEDEGYNVIIVDSLSHAWAGAGGLLDKQGQAERKTGNSFTAWREITPQHNSLVEALLTSPAHIIATMRVRTEYVMEEVTNRAGKKVMQPRKVGLQPVQRDGLEYEFTVVMDVDAEHRASASKDRTRLFDGWNDIVTERVGTKLREWLEAGAETSPPIAQEPKFTTDPESWIGGIERRIYNAKSDPERITEISAAAEDAKSIDDLHAIAALPSVKKLAQLPDNKALISASLAGGRKRLSDTQEPIPPQQTYSAGGFVASVDDPDTGEVLAGPFMDEIEWAESFLGYWEALAPKEAKEFMRHHAKTILVARRNPEAEKLLTRIKSLEAAA